MLSSGTGTCAVPNPPVAPGSYSYYAVYNGDNDYYLASPPSALATVQVMPASTSVSLTVSSGGSAPSSAGSSAFGASVTLNAAVSVTNGAGTPTGTVTFYDGTGEIGSHALSNGSYSMTVKGLQQFSSLPVQLSAVYSPTANFVGSTGYATDSITFTKTVSSLNSSLNVSSGQQVLVTGTVSGSVSVSSGGALEVQGGTIGGSVSSSGAKQLTICGTKIVGSLSVSSSSGFVFIGGPT